MGFSQVDQNGSKYCQLSFRSNSTLLEPEKGMKKFAVYAVICFFLVLPTISFGASGMYGSFNAGVAIPRDDDITNGSTWLELEYDPGFTVGGAIGYKVKDYRLEGEVAYQNNEVNRIENMAFPVDIGDGEILSSMEASLLTFLLNGYIDFENGTAFTPFFTAGFGFARIDGEMTVDGVTDDEDDTVPAFQLGVGVGYAVTDTVTLDCKYRYLYTDDFDIEDAELGVASHNITVGIRVGF
jgi:opacity protein-like surface antigen